MELPTLFLHSSLRSGPMCDEHTRAYMMCSSYCWLDHVRYENGQPLWPYMRKV